MYMYIHTYISICIMYIYKPYKKDVYLYIYVCMYICIYMNICTYIYLYICR